MTPARLVLTCALLVLLMLPVWPVSGTWFGLPAWAVWAVAVSAVTSVWIAWTTTRLWPEDEADDGN